MSPCPLTWFPVLAGGSADSKAGKLVVEPRVMLSPDDVMAGVLAFFSLVASDIVRCAKAGEANWHLVGATGSYGGRSMPGGRSIFRRRLTSVLHTKGIRSFDRLTGQSALPCSALDPLSEDMKMLKTSSAKESAVVPLRHFRLC